jgi:hypothetical protein
MKRSTPEQLRRCDEKLDREAVLSLILTYRPRQNVVWSPSRILYRLQITKTKSGPSDLKRRARLVLEALEREGILIRKGGVMTHAAGREWRETGYILSPAHGSVLKTEN